MKSSPFLGAVFVLLATAAIVRAEVSFAEGATKHLRDATKGDTSGVAVLIARDGEIVFQGGFGLADLEKKTPVTVETKFRIGSITKQFTAAAVLRLAEQGKLAVSEPLSKFFPDFPRGGEVTLRHLLTHTSGIHSYTDRPDFLTKVSQPIPPGALIESFKNDPPISRRARVFTTTTPRISCSAKSWRRSRANRSATICARRFSSRSG